MVEMSNEFEEERKRNPDNLFLMRYIAKQRQTHPYLKMYVNGKEEKDIDGFLDIDLKSRVKHYNITFNI